MLQTDSCPSKSFLSIIGAEMDPTCLVCGEDSSLEHMLWRCPALRVHEDVTSSKWDAALRSPNLKQQLWAVQQAQDAAERLGLYVPTWERPATS
uniref:Tick transposon n=1 Tax=Rhipicephalus appendiculatus TaxID=34631 RepID=A0A131Z2D3_RHIAP